MRVGDCFVDSVAYRPWKITGWYKGRVGDCPHVVALDADETDIFAGCAEPFGPLSDDDALTFSDEILRAAALL